LSIAEGKRQKKKVYFMWQMDGCHGHLIFLRSYSDLRNFCGFSGNKWRKVFREKQQTGIPRSAKTTSNSENQKIMVNNFHRQFSLAFLVFSPKKKKLSVSTSSFVSLDLLKKLSINIFHPPSKSFSHEKHGKCASVEVCVRAGLYGEKIRENLWLKGKRTKIKAKISQHTAERREKYFLLCHCQTYDSSFLYDK
jgi:hypothetical protein